LVLGLVGLIDAKGIDVAQPTWSRGCLTEGQKQPKNARTNLWKKFFKKIENWWIWKMNFFLGGHFEFFFPKKIFFFSFLF
jgi:hypothetical protein